MKIKVTKHIFSTSHEMWLLEYPIRTFSAVLYNYCIYRTYVEGLAVTHTISIHKNPDRKKIDLH
jgi:hypothetical protein